MYSSSLWTWNMYDWHVFWKWHEKIQGAWDCWIAIIPLKSMISVASIQFITARWKENNWNGGTLKKTPFVITKSMSFLRPAVWKNGSPIFRCQWLLQEESATSPIILWRRYSVTDEYRCVRTLRGCSLPGGGGSSAFWTLAQIMPNFRPQNGCLWIAKPPTFPPSQQKRTTTPTKSTPSPPQKKHLQESTVAPEVARISKSCHALPAVHGSSKNPTFHRNHGFCQKS